MESTDKIFYLLVSSSLWLTGAGLVLWLCLKSHLQISPGTRAAASVLAVLQGWIWFGIPVQLDTAWIYPLPTSIQSLETSRADDLRVLASRPLQSRLRSGSERFSAASLIPSILPVLVAAACVIWIAGIAVLLGKSTSGFLALSRVVRALPRAPMEWQTELSELCCSQAIIRAPVLKLSNVATPMLVQTLDGICIVVPTWLWESCTAGQRTSILLHELAHYRRGDLWRQLAVRLLVLPHWFNPVAWWAAGQFQAACEAACDDAACGRDPLVAISYSRALLGLNERIGVHYAHALAISGSSLTDRIRRLLRPEFQNESQLSRFLILAAMIVLISMATIRIQSRIQSPPPTSNSAENQPVLVANDRTTIVPAQSPAISLLANGGFEQSQENSDDPLAWFGTRLSKTANHFYLGAMQYAPHSGKRSVVVEIGENHPDHRVDYNWTAVVHGWEVGQTYELSGWIKVENAQRPAFIMATCRDQETNQGKRLGFATTERQYPVTGTTGWIRVSTHLTVPEGTSIVRIRAGLSSQNNRGAKAWFDDLALVPIGS